MAFDRWDELSRRLVADRKHQLEAVLRQGDISWDSDANLISVQFPSDRRLHATLAANPENATAFARTFASIVGLPAHALAIWVGDEPFACIETTAEPAAAMEPKRQPEWFSYPELPESLDKRAQVILDRLLRDICNNCVRLASRTESPIEQIMAIALIRVVRGVSPGISIQIEPQEWVGASRVDFLLTAQKRDREVELAVECDGAEFHEGRELADFRRDEQIRAEGVGIVHFTGSEINADALKCARSAVDSLLRILDGTGA